jgi:hypothetical protein
MAYRRTAIILFLGLFLRCLWLASPSFPVAHFSRWLFSKCTRCFLLKAARPDRLPKVRAGPGVPPSSSIKGSTGTCTQYLYPPDYTVWTLPWKLKLGWLSFPASGPTEPHAVTFVVVRAPGQTVITSFRQVTGQLQVLAGIIVDVV